MEIYNILMGVEVVRAVDESVVAVLPVAAVNWGTLEFMQVNTDVWVEIHEDSFDIPSLLTLHFHMFTTGVEIRSKLALEIGNTVDIIAGENLDIHPL